MVELIQATCEDSKFLYNLKKKTLREYVSKTWGWDERWQKNYHSQHFKPELLKVITKSGKKIGCLSIIEEENRFFLSIIEILPQYQNQGIGTGLIIELISKAKKRNLPVYLQALRTNVKAQKLYKDLGFSIESTTDTHYKMVYKKTNKEEF
ncbi:MAG: GNAT family N-acetyltransferase [Promethearchaeota archaeon]|jgi:ribosomal protein S18 acetylase RimI-like enzyme